MTKNELHQLCDDFGFYVVEEEVDWESYYTCVCQQGIVEEFMICEDDLLGITAKEFINGWLNPQSIQEVGK